MAIFDFLKLKVMVIVKKQRKKRTQSNQGIYGINAKKSKIHPVNNRSDISTKVKSIIVKQD